MERISKIVGICGFAVAAAFTFAGCEGFGGGDKETETTATVSTTFKPAVETVTATESTTVFTTTTTTKETESTIGAGLEHDGSTVVETEPLTNTFIISDSNSRYLSKDELKSYDAATLRLARNEIYAKHGCIFKDEKLLEYFKGQSWYNPTIKADDFKDSMLNDYEKKNVYLIKEMEGALSDGGNSSSGGGSKETSKKDKVLKSIEGSWTTGGNSGLIHKNFNGDTMTDSNSGSEKITDVVRFSNSDGEGYMIYLEGGTIYYLFDDDPDFLECHNVSGGYSGADSLVRD